MKKINFSEEITNPEALEKYYRENKKAFTKEFYQAYPELEDHTLARYWKTRLDFDNQKEKSADIRLYDIAALIITCVVVGFLIKIPAIFNLDPQTIFFYERNAGLVFFFGLSLYAVLMNNPLSRKHYALVLIAFLIPAIYINLLPSDPESHSVTLAHIHLPLLMWCIYGLVYIGFDLKTRSKRIDFIKHNGDLAIIGAIIMIAGGFLTGITIQLFSAIDMQIENFYMEYVVIWGLVSAPVVASFIIRNFPLLTRKIAPIIAGIFSPLVLITLLVYLVTIAIVGKNPYSDRDFLLVFNLMLMGVLGVIVFSVTEASLHNRQKFHHLVLFLLVAVAIIINTIALSAIVYRLSEFGFTPNKTAVLAFNLLVFINLLLIMADLYKINFGKSDAGRIERTIAGYLPVYLFYTLMVVFAFPVLFGMK
jgi:hypothetical protein